MQALGRQIIPKMSILSPRALVNLIWAFSNAGIPDWNVLNTAAMVALQHGQLPSNGREAARNFMKDFTSFDMSIMYWSLRSAVAPLIFVGQSGQTQERLLWAASN